MFGKRSSTDNFVMTMGRKAGNIKTAKAPASVPVKAIKIQGAVTGVATNSHKKVAAPKVTKVASKGKVMPSGGGALTEGLHTGQYGKMSLGKVNTFKINK